MLTNAVLRVLMIGNSFSVCVGHHLPGIVRSAPGCELRLTSAYIGGCSLKRHWNNVLATRDDPEARQYAVREWTTDGDAPVSRKEWEDSLNELLARGDWDVVTIQQASPGSWDYATYQPYADQLVAYIREQAPAARIWIQQTWAYNAADARISPGGAWGFDQAGMHRRLSEAYAELAVHLGGAPVIPTGDAVALWRSRHLADSPDIVGNGTDTIHFNRRGEYLQAATWFLSLYGREDFPPDVYAPDFLSPDEAERLRAAARDAVAARR